MLYILAPGTAVLEAGISEAVNRQSGKLKQRHLLLPTTLLWGRIALSLHAQCSYMHGCLTPVARQRKFHVLFKRYTLVAECAYTACSYQVAGQELHSLAMWDHVVAAGGQGDIFFFDRRTHQPLVAFNDMHMEDVTQASQTGYSAQAL